ITQESVPVTEFKVEQEGQEIPITKTDVSAPNTHDPDRPKEAWEHLVGVHWIDTVPLKDAIKEKAFSATRTPSPNPAPKNGATRSSD
ncbi:MAG: hypothetical protein R6U88_03790, partial [Candidatus Bipolaricaulota bacterium]